MIKMILTLLAFSISSSAVAQGLDCQISIDNLVVLKTKVSSLPKQKVGIGKNSSVTAYVTQYEQNLYSVEAFLPDYEARIYAQGSLSQNSDVITASLWGRELVLDVSCRLAMAQTRGMVK